jgi:tRNA1(Val) A37 N6-methylase TrmN6
MKNIQATELCREFIRRQVQAGDLCIDATAGNGHDTLLLSQLAGETGRVLAFDIQEQALEQTARRLEEAGTAGRSPVRLIRDSHANMADYAEPETVSCIVFNFGYLPGGDHTVATDPETSAAAVMAALSLLKRGGLLSLCIYSGGDTGFRERERLLELLKTLDSRSYLVLCCEYYNREHFPPLPVQVIRLR